MLRSDPIRRWRRVGLCSLLCLAVHGLAIAQTETSTPPPKKPAQTSASHTTASHTTAAQTTAAHSTAAHGTTTHTTATHSTATHTAKAKHSTSAHAATTHASTHTSSSLQKSKSSHGKKGSKQVAKKRGQQAIDSDRAREIQTALIRERYMQGEPTGAWDGATQAAMQRYQADQGWQSKTTPDSRALIKLGLGPTHDHLLNPENAMTAAPAPGDPKAAAKQAPATHNLPQQ
jgi:hypothetical protein